MSRRGWSPGRVPSVLGISLTGAAGLFALATALVAGSVACWVLAPALFASLALHVWQWRRGVRERAVRPAPVPPSRDAAGAGRRNARTVTVIQEDVRLPLTILGEVGGQLSALEQDRVAEAARAVQEESSRLVQVLDQLLQSSGLEEGIAWRFESVSMGRLIERVVERHRCLLQALDVRIRVLSGHGPDRVRGDRAALLEALGAFVTHTVTCLEPGAVLEIRTREVAGLYSIRLHGSEPRERAPEESLAVERARRVLALHGGEAWGEQDGAAGFGLTLPLGGREAGRSNGRELAGAAT